MPPTTTELPPTDPLLADTSRGLDELCALADRAIHDAWVLHRNVRSLLATPSPRLQRQWWDRGKARFEECVALAMVRFRSGVWCLRKFFFKCSFPFRLPSVSAPWGKRWLTGDLRCRYCSGPWGCAGGRGVEDFASRRVLAGELPEDPRRHYPSPAGHPRRSRGGSGRERRRPPPQRRPRSPPSRRGHRKWRRRSRLGQEN